jgi:hypothetical protein
MFATAHGSPRYSKLKTGADEIPTRSRSMKVWLIAAITSLLYVLIFGASWMFGAAGRPQAFPDIIPSRTYLAFLIPDVRLDGNMTKYLSPTGHDSRC